MTDDGNTPRPLTSKEFRAEYADNLLNAAQFENSYSSDELERIAIALEAHLRDELALSPEELKQIEQTVQSGLPLEDFVSSRERHYLIFQLAMLPRMWRTLRHVEQESQVEDWRRQLKRLRRLSAQLAEELDSLPPIVRNSIEAYEVDEDAGGGMSDGVDIDRLGSLLAETHRLASEQLERGIAASRKGPKVESSRKLFITSVIILWEGLTGEPAGYTWDEVAECYKGPFLEFAYAVASPVMDDYNARDFVEWVKKGRAAKAGP